MMTSMEPKALVERLCGSPCEFAPEETVDTARAAFLANLAELLKITFPAGCSGEESPHGKMRFYAGVVAAFPSEIPGSAVKDAHLVMIFPSNRAIISRLLYGPGDVTSWGVPANYGIE